MQLPELLAYLKAKSVEVLRRDGHHSRILFRFPPPGTDAPGEVVPLGDADPTDARREAKAEGSPLVATVAEVWLSPASAAEWGIAPSEDPDRREALHVVWEALGPGGEWRSGTWLQLFHREGERIVVDELLERPGPASTE